MGLEPGRYFRAREAWALALAAAVAAGCQRDPANVTGLRVITTWRDVAVDQLEFSVYNMDGDRLVEPQRRPARPQPLTTGADVVIYLPDGVGGQDVRCDVRGFADGTLVGTAEGVKRVVAGTVAEATVALQPAPRAKVQGAACNGEDECQSRICVDGVCCQTECAGACRSCAVPGKQGTSALCTAHSWCLTPSGTSAQVPCLPGTAHDRHAPAHSV